MPCNTSSTSVILFVSGASVALLTHFFAAYRESKNRSHADDRARKGRKTNLLAFLRVWSSQVEANRPVYTAAANLSLPIANLFDERRLELLREATPIEWDFKGEKRTRFKGLVDGIANMTPGQVGDEQGRNKLLAAITTLAELLKEP